jgi:hypothetical protein
LQPRCAPLLAAVLVLTLGGGNCASSPAEPIRIGAVFSESGGLASIGAPGLAGMRLAAEEINARGGILGGGSSSSPPTAEALRLRPPARAGG